MLSTSIRSLKMFHVQIVLCEMAMNSISITCSSLQLIHLGEHAALLSPLLLFYSINDDVILYCIHASISAINFLITKSSSFCSCLLCQNLFIVGIDRNWFMTIWLVRICLQFSISCDRCGWNYASLIVISSFH